MEAISWNLLFQIPLAGVVVFVVVLFLRHLKETTVIFTTTLAKQTEDAATAVTKQAETTALVQEKQITLFMDAIKDQREENIKAVTALTSKIDGLNTLIASSLMQMKSARSKATRTHESD